MSNKELLDLIDTIPCEILTYGNSEYTVQEITFAPKRVDINFILDNSIICFIKVFGNNTIHLAYFEDEEEKPKYKDCFAAMEQTKTYLEILGFKIL